MRGFNGRRERWWRGLAGGAIAASCLAMALGAGLVDWLAVDARGQRAESPPSSSADATVGDEHATIGLEAPAERRASHTMHPDAQWFGDAGFGLFIHWTISSVRSMNCSWPMIPGRPLANRRLDDQQRERVIREMDYNLNGRPPEITPLEYWQMAVDFNPQQYDPDKWMAAAKEAGFRYAVLTAKHHDGFALWPSQFGDFNTKNYMEGRDLIGPYVEACRRHGIKVGLYFSGPDWHFDQNHFSFLYYRARQANPLIPRLGPDLRPTPTTFTPEETATHQAAYAALVRGQVEELLTNYGKIDLIWFDGRPSIPDGDRAISIERIRELQPHIVINPRMHGRADYVTYERRLETDEVAEGWAEFCNPWTSSWTHQEIPFRANGFILGQLARCRSLGINYLLGVGPMASGELSNGVYENMGVVAGWMEKHEASVHGVKPLPREERASVPATSAEGARYLFAIPRYRSDGPRDRDMRPHRDETLTLSGAEQPATVTLMGDDESLDFEYANGELAVELPVGRRTNLVDVVRVTLGEPVSGSFE